MVSENSAVKQPRLPAHERHFALILALLWTDRGWTKEEIFDKVPGYQSDPTKTIAPESLDRMFERDKKSLEEIGIRVSVEENVEMRNNQVEYRYLIHRGAFQLPDTIRFSPEEISLLTLAARVWQGESLSHEVSRALLKVRAQGVESPDPIIGVAPRLVIHDQIYRDLQSAIEQRLVIKFLYQKPLTAEARLREVEPLSLVTFKDHWLLYCYDLDREDYRTFLLARFIGDIQPSHTHFESRIEHPENQALAALQEFWSGNVARVQVQPRSVAEATLRRRDSETASDEFTLSFHFLDLHTLADELASHGPEVLVLAPEELREQVIIRLQKVLADHQEVSQ